MTRFNSYIFILWLSAIAVASCSLSIDADKAPAVPGTDMSSISGICSFDSRLPEGATKAMDEWAAIDQVTTRKLDANFLRIDEGTTANNGSNMFRKDSDFKNKTGVKPGSVNWEKAYLCEATVISSPDNTNDIHYRSVLFSPRQSYSFLTRANANNPELNDTTNFYRTRMVGWYPENCSLKVHDGTQLFEDSDDQTYTYTHTYQDESTRTFKSVKFTGLDGAKDIMVSNVCEAQHWHSKDPSKSEFTLQNNNGNPYRHPFGHYLEYNSSSQTFGAKYSNYFKFRHYLSGVRIWAFVPDQNTHALDMWGNITDVVLLDQPTSVCISLPEDPLYDANANSLSWAEERSHFNDPAIWGQAYDWGDPQNISVQTGPMFGDDSNHSGEYYTVDFSNLSMKGVGDIQNAKYLGYSLIQPGRDLEVEIHTRYGVYVSKVSRTYNYKDGSVDKQMELFEPGYYYDIYLSLQTDGTISAIIETRGEDKYYDLTRSVNVSPTGLVQDEVKSYKYANCYIIDPEDATYDKWDDINKKKGRDYVCDYSGFFFSGLVAGNGQEGIFNYNSQSFYPASEGLTSAVSAHLIWESSRSLVSDIELINGYVKFRVPGIHDKNNYSAGNKYTGPKGNAVIGVFDKDDVCLWSWHIWITDTPGELTYNGSVTVMDRNLGATFGGVPTSGEEALASYGLYYQWGRKDPSVGPPSYDYRQKDGATAEFYDYASDAIDSAIPMSLEHPSLKDGVEHPMYLILPTKKSDKGYTYDWLYYQPENILWGYDPSSSTAKKTIYDPCPFGYKVSAGELTNIMSHSTGYSSGTYGLSFTTDISGGTLFFPYAGYKGVDKGQTALTMSWSYVGQKGDYQEGTYDRTSGKTFLHRHRVYISAEESWTEDRALGTKNYSYGANRTMRPSNGTRVYTDVANRRTAASVRCVKDKNFVTMH